MIIIKKVPAPKIGLKTKTGTWWFYQAWNPKNPAAKLTGYHSGSRELTIRMAHSAERQLIRSDSKRGGGTFNEDPKFDPEAWTKSVYKELP